MNAKAIAALSAGGAIAALVPVLLKQVGAVEHLPDPPGGLFGSDQIVCSKGAQPFGVPDGALGIASFGTTLGLLMTREDWAVRALRWKLSADGAVAGVNVVRQLVQFRRICSWCMGAAAFTIPMVLYGLRTTEEESCT